MRSCVSPATLASFFGDVKLQATASTNSFFDQLCTFCADPQNSVSLVDKPGQNEKGGKSNIVGRSLTDPEEQQWRINLLWEYTLGSRTKGVRNILLGGAELGCLKKSVCSPVDQVP